MIECEQFTCDERDRISRRRELILQQLLENVKPLEPGGAPVLFAGGGYNGIWLEHNQDNLFLAEYAPEAAWESQRLFLRQQRADGLFPAAITSTCISYKQLQSVWPFARCALELAKKLNRPEADFSAVYEAGCRYDQWLERNRNRSGRGVVEMYCEYDTGHDRSPRVTSDNIPHRTEDAGIMPDLPVMPICAVDLSAMMYGGRRALAELADLLGRTREAGQWWRRGEELRERIVEVFYDPQDDFYYDVDPRGFRRYRTEHLTRLFLNEVVGQEEFDRLYRKYFEDPREFQTPFPFPSVSVSDPCFNFELPHNSWGGNTQALTALRALLWLPRYGRDGERKSLLLKWMRAFIAFDNPMTQELNPFNGTPIGAVAAYSPSLILFLEAGKLLAECRY